MHNDSPHPPDGEPAPPSGAPQTASTFAFSLELLTDPDTDPEAHQREWRQVDAHFRPRLHDFWEGRVRDPVERDALINDTWVRTFLSIRKLRAPGVMWRWLLTVSERVYLDYRRRRATTTRKERRALEVTATDLMGTSTTRADEVLALRDEIAVLIERADLDERDERILRLWATGAPHDDIATQFTLGTPANSRKIVERLIKRLRRALPPGGLGDGG